MSGTDFCAAITTGTISPPIFEDFQHYPVGQLSDAKPNILEAAGHLGRPGPNMDEIFQPDPELANELARYYKDESSFTSVQGFRDSRTYAVMSEGGSDNCQDWLFFEAPKGGQAKKLPLPPEWIYGDSDDNCEPHWGVFVRIRGQVGFLKRDSDIGHNFDVTLRFVPLINGQWARGCRLKLAYPETFVPRKVFLAKDSPISRDQLERLLPKIAEAEYIAEKHEERRFRISDDDTPALDLTQHTVTQLFTPAGSDKDFALPHFNLQDAEADKYKLSWRKGTERLGSVRLGGHSYVIRAGVAEVPPDPALLKMPIRVPYIIIFYNVDAARASTLADNEDPPIASALVDYGPGSPTVTVAAE